MKHTRVSDGVMQTVEASEPPSEGQGHDATHTLAHYSHEDGVNAFSRLLHWLCGAKGNRPNLIACRVIAMSWALNPDMMDARKLIKIEQRTKGAIARKHVYKLAISFAEEFGVRIPITRQKANVATAKAIQKNA